MLKTVAAFASQDGGTILLGVRDALQIVGPSEDSSPDQQILQVMGMIRDTIEPVPAYTSRLIEHEGKQVLAVEGGALLALSPASVVTAQADPPHVIGAYDLSTVGLPTAVLDRPSTPIPGSSTSPRTPCSAMASTCSSSHSSVRQSRPSRCTGSTPAHTWHDSNRIDGYRSFALDLLPPQRAECELISSANTSWPRTWSNAAGPARSNGTPRSPAGSASSSRISVSLLPLTGSGMRDLLFEPAGYRRRPLAYAARVTDEGHGWDPLSALPEGEPERSFGGRWEDRLWQNVPGPFYTGMSDNCWTGRLHAPRHVLYGGEYGACPRRVDTGS